MKERKKLAEQDALEEAKDFLREGIPYHVWQEIFFPIFTRKELNRIWNKAITQSGLIA